MQTYNHDERCKCGFIRISAVEEQRRMDEWNSYSQMVATTEAYRDFWEMRTAWKQGDFAVMKEIDKRVMSRNHETKNEYGETVIEPNDPESLLSKPSFPDPTTWNRYVVTQ